VLLLLLHPTTHYTRTHREPSYAKYVES
jgi:hypothetical protein